MDIDKILRNSAQSLYDEFSSHQHHTNRLEQLIHQKIQRRKNQRKNRMIYPAVSTVLVLGILLFIPTWFFPLQQSGSEQKAESLNQIIDVNQTVSYADDTKSPIDQFTLKKVIITEFNIQTDFQIKMKEGYTNPDLIKPYLTDENGREFYWNNSGHGYRVSNGNARGEILTFIPVGRYESPPKNITFHFEGFYYSIDGSIGDFTISLNEAYPKNISLNKQSVTIDKVYYDENEGEVNISFTNFPDRFFRQIRLRTLGTRTGSAGGDNQHYTYSLQVPKKDTYTIEVYSERNTYQTKPNIVVDLEGLSQKGDSK